MSTSAVPASSSRESAASYSASSTPSTSASKLEPLLILAKSTRPRGAAAANLIQQAISAPGIFFFGELLDVPGIAELASASEPELQLSLQLLRLFTYGTFVDYKHFATSQPAAPRLNQQQEFKLKQLTLLSLASQTKALPYQTLFEALDIEPTNVRQLEDLIIETIYAGLISGKLNRIKSRFEVHHVQGRDVVPPNTPPSLLLPSSTSSSIPSGTAQFDHVLSTFTQWQSVIESSLSSLQTRMAEATSTSQATEEQRQHHNDVLLQNLIHVQQQQEKLQQQQQQSQQQQQGGSNSSGKGKAKSSSWTGAGTTSSDNAMDIDDNDDGSNGRSGSHRSSSKKVPPQGVRGNKRSRA